MEVVVNNGQLFATKATITFHKRHRAHRQPRCADRLKLIGRLVAPLLRRLLSAASLRRT